MANKTPSFKHEKIATSAVYELLTRAVKAVASSVEKIESASQAEVECRSPAAVLLLDQLLCDLAEQIDDL